MWQRRIPPRQGGGVRTRRTRGGVKALPSREARSRTSEHVAALEPTSAGRLDPEPLDMWQRQSPHW
jgi:hypothetical protein